MFFVSHLYFDRVKRPSSGWVAVTSITHHYYIIRNKFENLHALQRKINTRALLPDERPSLYSRPEAEYSSTYRPTDLLYPRKLILPRTLCPLTVDWHPQDHGVSDQKDGYKTYSVKLGGFSNDDRDGNENNVKMQKGLKSETINFVCVARFLIHFAVPARPRHDIF